MSRVGGAVAARLLSAGAWILGRVLYAVLRFRYHASRTTMVLTGTGVAALIALLIWWGVR